MLTLGRPRTAMVRCNQSVCHYAAKTFSLRAKLDGWCWLNDCKMACRCYLPTTICGTRKPTSWPALYCSTRFAAEQWCPITCVNKRCVSFDFKSGGFIDSLWVTVSITSLWAINPVEMFNHYLLRWVCLLDVSFVAILPKHTQTSASSCCYTSIPTPSPPFHHSL